MKAPQQEKKEYEAVPAANHIGRLYSIVHIGVNDEEIKGETKQIDKVRLSFELPNELRALKEGEPEKPMVISQDYTFSMYKNSHLRKLVHGMLGVQLNDQEADAFDVDELLGTACMINVTHSTSQKGNVYANVVSAAPLPKGIEAPAAVNENFVFDVDAFDKDKFAQLPTFIQDRIKTSQNFINQFRDLDNEDPFSNKVEVQSVADMDFSAVDDAQEKEELSEGYDPKA